MCASRWFLILVPAMALAVACAEPVAVSKAPATLDVNIPTLALSAGTVAISSRADTMPDGPARRRAASFLSASGGSEELPPEFALAPAIFRYSSYSGFFDYQGGSNALGEGIMEYFASHARQIIGVTVFKGGQQVGTGRGVQEKPHFLPYFYSLASSAYVPLGASCGFEVNATTQHEAWHQVPIPGPWSGEWMKNVTTSYSQQTRQPQCTREERDVLEGGPGGDSRIHQDEWMLCRFEFWYNQYGKEIYRRLLYCTDV